MATEAITGLLFTAVYLRMGLGVEFLVLCTAVSLLLAVALIDLEHGLILNRITYPTIVVLVIMAPFWSELGIPRPLFEYNNMLASLLNSLIAGAGSFLFFLGIALAYPRGMGGGDVKLAGLLGLMVGFPGILVALWIAVVVGGVVAIILLILRMKGRKDAIPFGPFLALGAIAVLLMGSETTSRYQDMAANMVSFWT
jgi:leader peptidase (prepilin peptidase)/N-methyltransferase